jgi:phage gp36-like protein
MAGTVAYMTLVEFRAATLMPGSFVDELEAAEPGFIDKRLYLQSAKMDARLAKRYDAPFKQPYPVAIHEWLVSLVTYDAWLKRGIAATDQQAEEYKADRDSARNDLQNAADSELGLFDLPLRSDTDATGISRGFPQSYSEQSPYKWMTVQAQIGREEDSEG